METRGLSIAIIDDDEDDYILACEMLEEKFEDPLRLKWFTRAEEALAALRTERFDVHLVDYHLVGTDGLRLIECMRREGLPPEGIVMITGEGCEEVAAKAVRAGIGGYLTKGTLTPDGLCRAVREAHFKRTERARIEETHSYLEWSSTHDGLTGLLTRHALMAKFRRDIIEFSKGKGRRPTFMVLDLDGLKEINRREGHLIGDYVLATAARFVKESLPKEGHACRFACEELAVLLNGPEPRDSMEFAYEVIRRLEAETFPRSSDPGRLIEVSVCVGIARCHESADGMAIELVRRAYTALGEAKHLGPGSVCFSAGPVETDTSDNGRGEG